MNNYIKYVQCDENARSLPIFITSMAEQLWSASTQLHAETHHYTLLYCISGTFYIENEHNPIILKKKQGYIIHKGLDCILSVKKDTPCQLKLISFDGIGVPQILSYLRIEHISTFSMNETKFESDFANLFFNVQMHYNFRAAMALEQLLYNIFNTVLVPTRGKNLDIVNQYITEHYCSDIDIQTLAKIYGTSVSYLCREFKSHYGTTPIAYVNQLRMEKARRLLMTTTKKVQDIAVECGFINSDYFCSTFKKCEQCTPMQYRRHHHTYSTEDHSMF